MWTCRCSSCKYNSVHNYTLIVSEFWTSKLLHFKNWKVEPHLNVKTTLTQSLPELYVNISTRDRPRHSHFLPLPFLTPQRARSSVRSRSRREWSLAAAASLSQGLKLAKVAAKRGLSESRCAVNINRHWIVWPSRTELCVCLRVCLCFFVIFTLSPRVHCATNKDCTSRQQQKTILIDSRGYRGNKTPIKKGHPTSARKFVARQSRGHNRFWQPTNSHIAQRLKCPRYVSSQNSRYILRTSFSCSHGCYSIIPPYPLLSTSAKHA